MVKVMKIENCSGCLACALACYFFNTLDRVINKSAAVRTFTHAGAVNKAKDNG